MNTLIVALVVFACIFGAALVGMMLRGRLREHHLDSESKDVMKAGMGLVATMAALVLGLLVASAKSSHDAQKDGLDEIAANLTLLDNVLKQYGPLAQEGRETLRHNAVQLIARLWPAEASQVATLGTAQILPGGLSLYGQILGLSPANATQTMLQSQAQQIAASVGHQRLLLIAHAQSSAISGIFLIVLTFWLVVLFGSFGVLAPKNALVVASLFVSALSVSSAIFLTLELARPFGGLISISSTPLHNALAHLGE